MLRSDDYPKEHRRPYRSVAGDAGPPHSQDSCAGAAPWPGRGTIDPARVGRGLLRRSWFALSGPAAARRQKVDQRKAGFYSLTAKGREQLVEKTSEWQRLTRAMESILSGKAGPSGEEA